MYISNLHIDRFGIWTDLTLDSISDELNVVYGPNGLGKTTVVQFIRSMLYGFGNDIRNRYAPDDIGSVGGAVTLRGSSGQRVVRRYDNGDTQGRLTVQGSDGSVLGQDPLQSLLGNVPQSVFDRVFAPQFHDDVAIDRLIEHVLTHGFDAMGAPADVERLARLKEQLRDRQRELRELHAGDESFEQLTRRRHSLRQEIDALKASGADRRASVDRRLRKMDGELAELEEQLEELQQELRSLDAQIESREAERLRKEEAFRIARLDHERARAGRRETLRDVDAQLERWRRVLQDVEARGRQMRDTSELADTLEPDGAADPRRYLQQLESRIDEVQQIMSDSGLAVDADICQCRHWQSMFEPALREMREDVYRLCNEMSRWEKATSRTKQSSELGQLGRCEAELRTAIAGLSQRRQKLLAEIAQAGDVEGDLLTPIHPDLCACNEHPQQIDSWRSNDELSAEEQQVLAHQSAEIQQLIARRQQVQRDLRTVEDELLDLQQRRRQLESEFGALDHDRLETLRGEHQRVEQLLARLERRRELLAAIGPLERDIQAVEASLRQASVLREASDSLCRLTEGELREMTLTPQGTLSIHHRDGQHLRREQLSAGAQDQVHLSLCLALTAAYSRRGTRLPLILDDTFANIDPRDVPAAARVLREFARDGQQVLLFTRHQHVADAFGALDVVLRDLPRAGKPPVEVKRPVREHIPTFSALSDAQRREVNQQLNVIADEMDGNAKVAEYSPCNAEEFPGELTDRVRPERQRTSSVSLTSLEDRNTSNYFLLETSPIQDAPSIDAATAERFRKIDVLFVSDLLQLDVHQAADRLRHAGISASMIRHWQSEALLTCCVPRLRPYDARILVGCGIDDADQLARMEAAELRKRVERFAATSTGQVLLRSGNRYELSRLTDWIDAARKRQGQRSERHVSKRSSNDSERETGEPTDRSYGERRWREAAVERPSVAKRQATTTPTITTSASRRAKAQAVVLKMEQSDEPLRFYLSTADPLEAAPSIGPRMAERFEEIDIATVAEFLEADAENLATRLDRRRVTSETIRSWQQQTTLACRIPWLRGHDAQILVACGITDVESLARMEAGELWLIIEPFIETKQCMRIIRNGKAPDFEEVYRWIQWARNARRLQAA